MNTLKPKMIFMAILALAFLMAGLLPVLAQSVPTLTTDKADYAPGEIAILVGSGFQPDEPIDLSIAIDDPETGLHIGD